jgi:hypothetical protein
VGRARHVGRGGQEKGLLSTDKNRTTFVGFFGWGTPAHHPVSA